MTRWLVALLLLLASCAAGADSAPAVMPATSAPPVGGSIPYLALGDSYTIGEGAAAADRWPVQLAARARRQGLPLGNPDIIAQTGWTTAELLAAIRASGNQRTDYGLVSLLIGVNNQYRGQRLDTYRQEFRQLLARAVQFAGGRAGRVLVLSIPDWGQSPFASGRDQATIGRELDEFNAAARQECQRASVAFVDITPLTRAAGSDASQYVADGLHYSGEQMRQWVEQALPVVQQLLPASPAAEQ